MSYAVSISPMAIEKLKTVPKELIGEVHGELERLAAGPKSVSRRIVSPPFPPTLEQIFQFHRRFREQLHYFTVFFLYTDERDALYITHVTIDPPFCAGQDCCLKPKGNEGSS